MGKLQRCGILSIARLGRDQSDCPWSVDSLGCVALEIVGEAGVVWVGILHALCCYLLKIGFEVSPYFSGVGLSAGWWRLFHQRVCRVYLLCY